MNRELARLESIVGPVSRETSARLEAYCAAVERWTAITNLVAASTLPEIWTRHVIDSAQLISLCPHRRRWVDLGSGGGFPGIVIAILLAEQSEANVALVESNAKKAAFLSTIVGELSLPARVYRCRIENAHGRVGPVEVVTARALAPLPDLLELARPWLEDGAIGLFHKGRDFIGELAKSHDDWVFSVLNHQSVVNPESRILEISGLSRKPVPG